MTRDTQLREALNLLREQLRETLSSTADSTKKDFDVFISYRQAESKAIARRICDALRRGRHPRSGKALRVFLDEESIKIGQNIHVTLQTAITSSATFVILLTPTYNKTEYTGFEQMLIAGQDWGGLRQRIVPVLVQDSEIPERLRHIKYLDFRMFTGTEVDTSAESPTAVIRTHHLRVSQERFAAALVAHLNLSSLRGFHFIEEAGDLTPDGSYLEVEEGIKTSFSWEDISASVSRVCRDAAGALLDEGFFVSGFVVHQFAERYGQGLPLPADEPIHILLEKQERDLRIAPTADLIHALTSYAFGLPSEFDRSHLNALPRPSPSWDVLAELIRREAWPELKRCIAGVSSVSWGIAALWACEVVRRQENISDNQTQQELGMSKPLNPAHIREWAEDLLRRWTEVA